MSMRKINAGVSLLTTFLLLCHAISIAVWMFSKGSIFQSTSYIAWALTGLVLVHVFISIDIMISGIMSGEGHKSKKYLKMNLSTIIQRASGILMVIFTALHIAGAAGVMTPPKIVHGIVPPLFFAIVMAHVAVSTSKAFITLGIGNVKLVKIVDVVTKVICGATLIADVVGFYLYVW